MTAAPVVAPDILTAIVPKPGVCRILSLDGGGAKGFYTLGVLKEVEGVVGGPLSNRFDLIFGTSTGAIIAALLGLGRRVDDIHALYKKHVPTIMRRWTARGRTKALKRLAVEVFEELKFDAFKTGVGIVATNWDREKPLIFKSTHSQAHGQTGTFVPGFGCIIAEAVQASCSAYPFFKRSQLKTSHAERVDLGDGGFCANNPTLYAITDALTGLRCDRTRLRVVSIGVGVYPEPKRWWRAVLKRFLTVQLLQKTLDVNVGSMEKLRQLLFEDVPTVRISETYSKPEMATDLMEHSLAKLDLLYQLGRESFQQHEKDLQKILN